MMGRQINGTSEGVPGSLWKQGSLNLPAPEESGFPATHPDMCILRIRRNHLLEVGRCGKGDKQLAAKGAVASLLGLVCWVLLPVMRMFRQHTGLSAPPSLCPPPLTTGRTG